MKIQKVEPDNRRRRFEVTTRRGVLAFPYARCEPAPSPDDRLVEVFVDAELGREAITSRLESGAEGSIHFDPVLALHADPDYPAPPQKRNNAVWGKSVAVSVDTGGCRI